MDKPMEKPTQEASAEVLQGLATCQFAGNGDNYFAIEHPDV